MSAVKTLLAGGVLCICLCLPALGATPNPEPRLMQFVYTVWPQRGQYHHRMGLRNRFAVPPEEVDMSAPPGSDRENLMAAISRLKPDMQYDNTRLLTMDWWGKPEVDPTPLEWIQEQKQLGREVHRQMHEAGAGRLFAYVSAFRIFGNYEKRQGFWAFYDDWEDYGPLHFGPRPADDPWDWISIRGGERRQWRVNPDDYYGYRRYNACVQDPSWRRYMRAVCRNMAEDGLDAVFVDNTMHQCECPDCQAAFEEHLRAEYSADQLEEFFGTRDVTRIRINTRESVPNQIETRRVWQRSMAGLLEQMRLGGEDALGAGKFGLVTNGTAYGLLPGYCCAIGQWAQAGMTAGFNENDGTEMGTPQREIADGLRVNELQDQITYYQTVSGLRMPGVRAAPQLNRYYLRAHPECFTLAMFEALAFNGIFCDTGNLIGVYELFPNTEAHRQELYDFYHARHHLYSDIEPVAEVGVLLAMVDETLAENREYEAEAQTVRNLLLDHHVPSEFIPETALTAARLARYRVIFVPGITCLGDEHAKLLKQYVSQGGRLFVSGEVGTRHLCGAPRRRSCLAELLPESDGQMVVADVGQGMIAHFPGWLWRDGFDSDIPFRREADWYRRTALRGHNSFARMAGDGNRRLFAEALGRLLSSNPSLLTADSDAAGLRVSLFRKTVEAQRALIAHLVDYDVRWDAEEARDTDSLDQPSQARVRPRTCTLVLPTPPGTVPASVTCHRPGHDDVTPEFEPLADGVAVAVPEFVIYAAVEVALEEGAPAAERSVQDVLGPLEPRQSLPFFGTSDEVRRPIPEALLGPRAETAVSPWLGLDQAVIVPRDAGEELAVRAETPAGSDWGMRVWVISPTGEILFRAGVPAGDGIEFALDCETAGTYLICGDAGYAHWRVAVRDAQVIIPATEGCPAQLGGMAEPMRFLVPEGVRSFTVTTRAAQTGIGLVVLRPNGQEALAVSLENSRQTHTVVVPEGEDGRVWSLQELCEGRDYHRAVPVCFSEEIPGFIAG